MGISYALPVAECDLHITSKQQYGIVSGVWFAGMCSYNAVQWIHFRIEVISIICFYHKK